MHSNIGIKYGNVTLVTNIFENGLSKTINVPTYSQEHLDNTILFDKNLLIGRSDIVNEKTLTNILSLICSKLYDSEFCPIPYQQFYTFYTCRNTFTLSVNALPSLTLFHILKSLREVINYEIGSFVVSIPPSMSFIERCYFFSSCKFIGINQPLIVNEPTCIMVDHTAFDSNTERLNTSHSIMVVDVGDCKTTITISEINKQCNKKVIVHKPVEIAIGMRNILTIAVNKVLNGINENYPNCSLEELELKKKDIINYTKEALIMLHDENIPEITFFDVKQLDTIKWFKDVILQMENAFDSCLKTNHVDYMEFSGNGSRLWCIEHSFKEKAKQNNIQVSATFNREEIASEGASLIASLQVHDYPIIKVFEEPTFDIYVICKQTNRKFHINLSNPLEQMYYGDFKVNEDEMNYSFNLIVDNYHLLTFSLKEKIIMNNVSDTCRIALHLPYSLNLIQLNIQLLSDHCEGKIVYIHDIPIFLEESEECIKQRNELINFSKTQFNELKRLYTIQKNVTQLRISFYDLLNEIMEEEWKSKNTMYGELKRELLNMKNDDSFTEKSLASIKEKFNLIKQQPLI
ncbi:Chaperone protein dnaK [Entamoeba marina]